MRFATGFADRQTELVDLFTATFAASEGAEEGARIGGFVADLLARTPPADIRLFRAEDDGRSVGAVAFTRLAFPEDPRRVVLLSPIAVATGRQGQGVGQALLAHSFAMLRVEGVEVIITYGDPRFYGRVGFAPIAADMVRPPLPLSFPHGWLALSLTNRPVTALKGPSTCVPALDRADLW